MSNHPETPADRVICAFGGASVVAKALGLSRVQVNRWKYPRTKGGAGGTVPSRHHETLLRLAAERGIDLAPSDLMPWLERENVPTDQIRH